MNNLLTNNHKPRVSQGDGSSGWCQGDGSLGWDKVNASANARGTVLLVGEKYEVDNVRGTVLLVEKCQERRLR